MMNSKIKVVVGMSGGVDSSVAAALLVKAGYDVTGVMLRLWSESGSEKHNRCCTPDAMAQARRVAAGLGIPFYVADIKALFYERVVKSFIDGYARGVTPNPCLVCNRSIRWGFLLNYAIDLGADYFSTGHYARVEKDSAGQFELKRGADQQKDQSYVLSVLNQEQLAHTLLPLGGYTKPAVRMLARELNLEVAEKTDSQDLCFLAGEDYRTFLPRYSPQVIQPGPIQDLQGNKLGDHQGLANFTIGQRKGLGFYSAEPMYVLQKRVEDNSLVVGKKSELGNTELFARSANWIRGAGASGPFRAQVKIRYKAEDAWAMVTPLSEGRFKVNFEQPKRDITAGQAVVIYQGELCLGNGIIE
jgi:tRNA-specific 2-thiouridylase